MNRQRYLITNVVYGDLYSKIFLDQHLKSVLDPSNLPSVNEDYEIDYLIFTDAASKNRLEKDEQINLLREFCGVEFKIFDEQANFDQRYSKITQSFRETVKIAIKNKYDFVTAWVADLVVAKEFFPKILSHIARGHDSVFVLPMRTALEPMAETLNHKNEAMHCLELFKLGYENLHPLWVACEWNNRRFTKHPFTLLWSNPNGTLARSFSITPIIFKPNKKMILGRGMIDGDVPDTLSNPYWCENWEDAPVIGVEPLFCYYPTFSNNPPTVEFMRAWSRVSLEQSQISYLKHQLFYPNRDCFIEDQHLIGESDTVVQAILN